MLECAESLTLWTRSAGNEGKKRQLPWLARDVDATPKRKAGARTLLSEARSKKKWRGASELFVFLLELFPSSLLSSQNPEFFSPLPPPPHPPSRPLGSPRSPSSHNACLSAGALGAVRVSRCCCWRDRKDTRSERRRFFFSSSLPLSAPLSPIPPAPSRESRIPDSTSILSHNALTQFLDGVLLLGQGPPGLAGPPRRLPSCLDRCGRRRRHQDRQDRHARLAARACAGLHDARPAQGAFF